MRFTGHFPHAIMVMLKAVPTKESPIYHNICRPQVLFFYHSPYFLQQPVVLRDYRLILKSYFTGGIH